MRHNGEDYIPKQEACQIKLPLQAKRNKPVNSRTGIGSGITGGNAVPTLHGCVG